MGDEERGLLVLYLVLVLVLPKRYAYDTSTGRCTLTVELSLSVGTNVQTVRRECSRSGSQTGRTARTPRSLRLSEFGSVTDALKRNEATAILRLILESTI